MTQLADAGWFDDPLDTSGGQERWWSGEEWTRHVVPKQLTKFERVAFTGHHHRQENVDEYPILLREVRQAMGQMVESGGAIESRLPPQPSICELMLRAYNREADALVGSMIPDRLNRAIHQLDLARRAIDELGCTHSLAIAPEYHKARIRELELEAHIKGWAD